MLHLFCTYSSETMYVLMYNVLKLDVTDKVRVTVGTCIQLSIFLLDRGRLDKMIFLQIILIIGALFANISCTTLEQLEEKFINLQQKNSQLETTVNLLKNTVDENQATIQVLKEEVKVYI